MCVYKEKNILCLLWLPLLFRRLCLLNCHQVTKGYNFGLQFSINLGINYNGKLAKFKKVGILLHVKERQILWQWISPFFLYVSLSLFLFISQKYDRTIIKTCSRKTLYGVCVPQIEPQAPNFDKGWVIKEAMQTWFHADESLLDKRHLMPLSWKFAWQNIDKLRKLLSHRKWISFVTKSCSVNYSELIHL